MEPPRLLWPSIAYTTAGALSSDTPHFPAKQDVHARRDAYRQDYAMRLVAFEIAVMDACQRLLVLDPHFDEVGVRALRDALEYSQANEIRFLTGHLAEDDRTTWRRQLEQQINRNRTDHREVEINWRRLKGRSSFPFLHDRFAVVDDALWHFGATVGGGHPGVNAASGPWSAVCTKAITFFDECWRTLR